MKNKIILSIIFCFPLFGLAQSLNINDTVFFDKNWNECSQKEYKFYRTFEKSTMVIGDSNLIKIIDHYRNGNIQMTGYRYSLDSLEKVGLYSYYKKNGRIISHRLYNYHETIKYFKEMEKYTEKLKVCDSVDIGLYVSFFRKGHVRKSSLGASKQYFAYSAVEYNPIDKGLYSIIEYSTDTVRIEKVYNEEDYIFIIQYYLHGERYGTWRYYSSYDGHLKKTKVYENGKRIEKIKY